MKVYVLILGLFAICINGCNTNNRNEKPKKDVVVKESTHPVAEVVPPKIAARPLLPGKRTGKLDDIPAVAKAIDAMRRQRQIREHLDTIEGDGL